MFTNISFGRNTAFRSQFVLRQNFLKFSLDRFDVKAHAVSSATSGVVPPDVIEDDFKAVPIAKEVIDLANKFEDFTDNLKPLPPSSDSTYPMTLEENSKKVWAYAKKQFDTKLKGKPGFSGDTNILFDPSRYGATGAYQHTEALSKCRKVFARGSFIHFWDAIGTKVQVRRELEQRIDKDLGIKAEEFNAIKDNLTYIGKGFSYAARTLQSEDYIKGQSVEQKLYDIEAFEKWYKTKSDPLVQIIRMNISDMPLGYALTEIQDFEKNPQDSTKRTAIFSKLKALQKEAITELRNKKAAGQQFSLSDFLKTK